MKRGPRDLTKKTIPQLIKTLDDLLSEYTRKNYAVAGFCKCFTCTSVLPWKEMHCGHYIPRTESPTRHDERNLRPQCTKCNTYRSGLPHEFRRNLVDEIGLDSVQEIEALSRQSWKWNRARLEEQIQEYRGYLKELP